METENIVVEQGGTARDWSTNLGVTEQLTKEGHNNWSGGGQRNEGHVVTGTPTAKWPLGKKKMNMSLLGGDTNSQMSLWEGQRNWICPFQEGQTIIYGPLFCSRRDKYVPPKAKRDKKGP